MYPLKYIVIFMKYIAFLGSERCRTLAHSLFMLNNILFYSMPQLTIWSEITGKSVCAHLSLHSMATRGSPN